MCVCCYAELQQNGDDEEEWVLTRAADLTSYTKEKEWKVKEKELRMIVQQMEQQLRMTVRQIEQQLREKEQQLRENEQQLSMLRSKCWLRSW